MINHWLEPWNVHHRDGCFVPVESIHDQQWYRASDHTYSYSMGIGDAWTVTHPNSWHGGAVYEGGTLYMYGLGEAHYPVPATELDGALAASCERVTPLVKKLLLERV